MGSSLYRINLIRESERIKVALSRVPACTFVPCLYVSVYWIGSFGANVLCLTSFPDDWGACWGWDFSMVQDFVPLESQVLENWILGQAMGCVPPDPPRVRGGDKHQDPLTLNNIPRSFQLNSPNLQTWFSALRCVKCVQSDQPFSF